MNHDTAAPIFRLGTHYQKAIIDYGLTALLIIPAALVMAVIAVAIKLYSPGPVLFRQRRQGLNHQNFIIIKFRTMSVIEGSNDLMGFLPDDERVTQIGRFLRLTGLDELPQFFNVLKGEMSLIGPRPHPIALNQKYQSIIKDYAKRHKVKPGISGWAQINGSRGNADTPSKMKARIEYDLFYIDNWSILLDIRIFLMTIFLLLRTLFNFQNRDAKQ